MGRISCKHNWITPSACRQCLEDENDQLSDDLADARQKLAEAQADCAALREAVLLGCKLNPVIDPTDRESPRYADTATVTAALASNAGDALVKELESLRRRVKALPADWLEDSSLETWFPLTAKELERLRAEMAKAHEETRWWHQCLTLVSHALTGNTEALTNLSEDSDWKRAFECVAFQQAKDLRAQRDQAVALARELGERLQEECNIDDRTGKPRWSNTREALAKLQFLNPPPSDDTLKV